MTSRPWIASLTVLALLSGPLALLAGRQFTRDRVRIPEIQGPLLFNTPQADRILARLQVFPPDNPFNEDISRLPVHPLSRQIIASIGPDKPLAFNWDMSFIL